MFGLFLFTLFLAILIVIERYGYKDGGLDELELVILSLLVIIIVFTGKSL